MTKLKPFTKNFPFFFFGFYIYVLLGIIALIGPSFVLLGLCFFWVKDFLGRFIIHV